jgi:hypothetical protein
LSLNQIGEIIAITENIILLSDLVKNSGNAQIRAEIPTRI